MTLRSGAPILAPIAAAGEKPIVAKPPLVMNDAVVHALQLLPRAVLVPAHVGDEDGIRRARPSTVPSSRRAGWMGVPPSSCVSASSRSPIALAFLDDLRTLAYIACHARQPSEAIDQRLQRGLRIADDADLHGIDLSDLDRIDVDLDQIRDGGIAERVLGSPRAAVRLAEGSADRKDDVGFERGRIGRAAYPRCPSCQVQADGLRETRLCPSASSRPELPGARPALCSSLDASLKATPLPAKMTGRAAVVRSRAASAMPSGRPGSAPVRRPPCHGAGLCVHLAGEHIHRHVDQHRARPARLRQIERARHHVRQKLWHRRRATRACRWADTCRPATHPRAA